MLLFAGCCRCHPPRSAPADPRHHASTAPVVAPAPVRGVACFKQPISAGLGGSSGSAAIFHRTLTFRESRVRRGDPAAPGPYELGRSARFRSGRFRILRFGCDPDDRRWQGLTVGASGHYNRQEKNSLSYAVLPCGPCRAIRRPVQSRCPTLLGLRWRRPQPSAGSGGYGVGQCVARRPEVVAARQDAHRPSLPDQRCLRKCMESSLAATESKPAHQPIRC